MFSVAKKSFEEYLFGFTFVLLYFRWGILAEIISGFAKSGVVFSDTSFIGASFSVTSFICPPFMGSLLRVSFRVGSSCRGSFCLETEVHLLIASCMDAMTSSGFSHQSIVQMRQMFQPSAFNTLFWTISRSRAVFVRL